MLYTFFITSDSKALVLIVFFQLLLHMGYILQKKRLSNLKKGTFILADYYIGSHPILQSWSFLKMITGLTGSTRPKIVSLFKIFKCYFKSIFTLKWCSEKVVRKDHSNLFISTFLFLGANRPYCSVMEIFCMSFSNIPIIIALYHEPLFPDFNLNFENL